MTEPLRVVTVPLLGPFHTRFPRYNAVDVRDAVRAAAVQAIAVAALPPGAFADPAWQATDEIALPLAVVPWAQRAGVPLHAVGSISGQPGEPGEEGDERDFLAYLDQLDAGKARLKALQQARAPVEELLRAPLDLARITSELLPALEEFQRVRLAELGEGPGTGWSAARAAVTAERIAALPYGRVALLAGVDELPEIARALLAGPRPASLEAARSPTAPSEEARRRALLDVAMRGDAEDPEALIEALREIGSPEADYHEANLLLEHGQVEDALEALERALRGELHEPYFLAGFLLARIGQVYDLLGRRGEALRSYRGVLALGFAPGEAVEAAEAGLEAPFGEEAARAAGAAEARAVTPP